MAEQKLLQLFGAADIKAVAEKTYSKSGELLLPQAVQVDPDMPAIAVNYSNIDKTKLINAIETNSFEDALVKSFIRNPSAAAAFKAMSRACTLLNAVSAKVKENNNGLNINVSDSTDEYEILSNVAEEAIVNYNPSEWFAFDEATEIKVLRHTVTLQNAAGELKTYITSVFGEEELEQLHAAHVKGANVQKMKDLARMLMPFSNPSELAVGATIVASEAYTLSRLGEVKVYGYKSPKTGLLTYVRGMVVRKQVPKQRSSTVQQQPAAATGANNSFLYGM